MKTRAAQTKLLNAVFFLICTSTLFACTDRASVSPGVSPELKHSWEVNFNRGDGPGVAALYGHDAQLIMSGSAPVRGAAAIRAVVDSMIRSGVKVHIESSENVGAGDLAYVFGTYSILDSAHGKIVEQGSYVEIWRHRNGEWKIAIDINATGSPTHS
jgi:ketosteroid isomerase-like protein